MNKSQATHFGFLPRRLAKRLAGSDAPASWSRPVVQIATYGVALGIALMIVASAIVHGFQQEVRNLVVGFGSDIQILSRDGDARNIQMQPELMAELTDLEDVKSIHPFYTLPGILESKESLEGVMVKGTGSDTYQYMLRQSMVEGVVPSGDMSDSLVLSSVLANRLKIGLGDRISLYLVGGPSGIRPRKMLVAGLYHTGLLEYDESFLFIPKAQIQRVAGWGLEAQVRMVSDVEIEALVFGTVEQVQYEWTLLDQQGLRRRLPWKSAGPHELENSWLEQGAEVELVARPASSSSQATGDTVWLKNDGDVWSAYPAGGGWRFHASGYEVFLKESKRIWEVDEIIYRMLPIGWGTETVLEQAPEMFTWLGMLDLNVEIIIGLMMLISVINMTSALLILILERRAMVGMLKAIGMANSQVMRMFFWQAVRILGRGFWIGNALGFALIFVQTQTGWVRLDPEAYYVEVVPVHVDLGFIVGMEFLTFAVCALMMWLPALASTRILPAEALKLKN